RLRRRLAEPPDRPRVAAVDLVVDSRRPVPDVVMGEIGEIQLGPGRNVDRAAAVLIDALEVDEELELVPDDRAADVAAPLNLARFGLRQILLLGEIIQHGEVLVLIEKEPGPVKGDRALLRDGIDDAARARAELGIELAGQELEL